MQTYFIDIVFTFCQRNPNMSEPKIQFKIILGGRRVVDRVETTEATLYFMIPKCKVPYGDCVEVTVNGLTVKIDYQFTTQYDSSTGTLKLDRFGKFGGPNSGTDAMITKLMAAHDQATIKEAFRQLAEKLQVRETAVPATAVNLLESSDPVFPSVKPAWFDLVPAQSHTVQKTIEEPDDIFFDVETASVQDAVVDVTVDGLWLLLTADANVGPQCNKSKGSTPTRFVMNRLGYLSENANFGERGQKAVRKLRAAHSDEKIQAAFQELAIKLLAEAEKNPSKKRRAPPTDALVWTPSIVTEIDLSKRLKATEIKSESMTE